MLMTPKCRAALLLNAAGASLKAYKRLCDELDPDDLLRGEKIWDDLGLSRGAKKSLAIMLSGADPTEWSEREIERAQKCGARFISIDDPDYPGRLMDLDQPPIGLYVRGSAELSLPSVAVVGTRKCSTYGRSVADAIGRALARVKMTVISGGARGIDAAGHRGALSAGGPTIAVVGTGIDKVYPSEHRELFERIAESGALISEFPMGANGEDWHFPKRNRLIIAMSGRTVVVESSQKGGAMISAQLALDLGREVWAVPGRINESICEGSNSLLANGATPLINIQDFVSKVSGRYGQLMLDLDFNGSIINSKEYIASASGTGVNTSASANSDLGSALSPEDKTVLSILQRQGNRTVDDLIAESKLDFATVQNSLVTLDLEGLIVESGGRYSASA